MLAASVTMLTAISTGGTSAMGRRSIIMVAPVSGKKLNTRASVALGFENRKLLTMYGTAAAMEKIPAICCDSRIGFEASNHYLYTANDLREKVLNCEHLLGRF